MKIGFLGDIHGDTDAARFMLWSMWKQGVEVVIQVGDFGIYTDNPRMKFANVVNELCKKYGIILVVVPGNHENWRVINEMTGTNRTDLATYRSNIFVAPRGYRCEMGGMSFVMLGGAPSVNRMQLKASDAARRSASANLDWYWEEQIRGEDVDYVVAGGYADVMIGHDAPHGIAGVENAIRGPHNWHIADVLYAEEGRRLLTEAFRGVNPAFYFHGHYHMPIDEHIQVHGGEWGEYTHVIGLNKEAHNFSTAILDTDTKIAYAIDHTTLLFQYRKDRTW